MDNVVVFDFAKKQEAAQLPVYAKIENILNKALQKHLSKSDPFGPESGGSIHWAKNALEKAKSGSIKLEDYQKELLENRQLSILIEHGVPELTPLLRIAGWPLSQVGCKIHIVEEHGVVMLKFRLGEGVVLAAQAINTPHMANEVLADKRFIYRDNRRYYLSNSFKKNRPKACEAHLLDPVHLRMVYEAYLERAVRHCGGYNHTRSGTMNIMCYFRYPEPTLHLNWIMQIDGAIYHFD